MLSLLLTLALQTDVVTVTLPLQAEVRGTEIELGEVARVTGDDPTLVARVAALEVGYAPSPGYSRVLVADRLRDVLRRRAPEVTLRFAGQRACRVYPEVVVVQAREIEEAARAELRRALGLREAELTPREPVEGLRIPAGSGKHRVSARLDLRAPRSGVITVPVEVHVDGVRYRTVWTSWQVDVFEVRPVLTRPVKAGEELSPDMFERRRVRLGTGTNHSLGQVEATGAVAKRDFRPGEEISTLDVHRPRVVAPGDGFFLMVRRGPVNARVSAVALEAGSVGDRIRVRTTGSERELVATIVHRDLCEIVLAP